MANEINNNGMENKTDAVRTMFDSIAPRYDFLNHFLSAGIDRRWRKKLVKLLATASPQKVLDVATGTADLAIAAASLTGAEITGIDISGEMLRIGTAKVKNLNLQNRITLSLADSQALPFRNDSYDAVMVAFGVRNFSDLALGLREMNRILRPSGKAFILEFSRPRAFPVKQLYSFYFTRLLPLIGRMVSKDRSAYSYLPDSVASFPDGDDFCAIMKDAGFSGIKAITLSFGIATIYLGEK